MAKTFWEYIKQKTVCSAHGNFVMSFKEAVRYDGIKQCLKESSCVLYKFLFKREVFFSLAHLNWLQGEEDESAKSTVKPD